MVGLIMINALLVLYLTKELHISTKDSYSIYAAFGSLFYSAALLGGYLGGRYDHKLAIIFGGVLASAGGFLLAIPEIQIIFLGLACFIVGGGLVIPNLNCIMGKLFSRNDAMRDSGFTIAYIGMNLGSCITAMGSGFIVRYVSFSAAFILSSAMMIVCLLTFLYGYSQLRFKKEVHVIPYVPDYSLSNFVSILVAILIFVPVVMWLLNHAVLSNSLLIVVGLIMIGLVSGIALMEKGEVRKKMFAFLIFTTFAVAFWSLYMMAPSALTIFIKHNVNRHIGSLDIPASSVYGLNGFFIVLIGLFTSSFFLSASKKGRSLPLSNKFAIGIISMGIGYLILMIGIGFANGRGDIALWWIVLSYFLQTAGELFVGPIGFAMVGSLVPSRLEGPMMGVWQLSVGVAGAISGFLADATARVPDEVAMHPQLTNPIFAHFFGLYGSVTVLIGIVIIMFSSQFNKLF